MKVWIVTANRTEAKFFSYANRSLNFERKIENPRGRLKNSELDADKPGFYWASGQLHGSNRAGMNSSTEKVAQEFARDIAEVLEECRKAQEFEELTVIADPHFLGLLRASFSKELDKLISREIPRDLGSFPTEDIQDRLWPHEGASTSI